MTDTNKQYRNSQNNIKVSSEYEEEYEKHQALYDDWALGISDPSLPDGTNSKEQRAETIESLNAKRPPKAIFASSNFNSFPDDYLIINDTYLTDVPVAAISMSSPTDVFVGETIRSQSPVISSEGRQDCILRLSLAFPPGEAQQVKLRRIMSQITRHPFVFVHNNNIKQKLALGEFDTTIFVLEAASLRSTAGTVGLIMLDMQLHYFNHRPFSKNFYYNAKLPGYSKEPENASTYKDTEELDLSEFGGYEASDYTISKLVERTRNKVRNEIINLDKAKTQNVPVNLPSESDAWMYYANFLDDQAPTIRGRPSDFVGFTLREYFHFNPPANARESDGSLSDLMRERYEDIDPLYSAEKWSEALAISSKYTPTTSTAQDKARDQLIFNGPAGVSSKSSQLATYKYKNKTLQIDDATALWLGRMLVGEGFSAKGSGSIQKGIYLLWTYVNRYFLYGKEWRSFQHMVLRHSQPINSRWLPGGDKYEKWKGTKYTTSTKVARRQRIRSLGWNQLPRKVRNLVQAFRQGKIDYPAQFKALDRKRPTNFASLKNLSTKYPWGISAGDREWFFEDENSRSGFVTVTPPSDSTSLKDSALLFYSNAPEEVAPKQEQQDFKNKQAENNDTPPPDTTDKVKERAKWIWTIQRGQNVQYYDADPKVRNVFYRDTDLTISSDKGLQQSGIALPNIVCSSISVSFGHRISQMRLLSQEHYTYQFLGAGNKSGQMVFVFAGEAGRDSANRLKKMFYSARDNARDFSSIIKGVGSVGLETSFYKAKEQNTILDLVNIKDIVITNIEEANSPDGADKHQLTLEFIVQDFASEKLEEKFATTLDAKKRMIKSILNHVVSQSARFNRVTHEATNKIKPKADIATINQSSVGRPYQLSGDTPLWVAELITEAAVACQEANDNMPPINWKLSDETDVTWNDIYSKWGAGGLFVGKPKKIYVRDRNARGMQAEIDAGLKVVEQKKLEKQGTRIPFDERLAENITPGEAHKNSISREAQGIFDKNGASETNKIHKVIFDDWLGKMNLLASELQTHMVDGEMMDKYFPDVVANTKEVIAGDMSSCYMDINLPTVPGTIVPLPPEFYVYDDSHEDPLVSSMTDENNMERFLQRHVETEFASVKYYIEDSFLGGSYISKNLPRILENRASEHKRSEGERGFSSYIGHFLHGAKSWEPIYTDRDRQDPQIEGVQKWLGRVSENYGEISGEDQRLSYLKDLVNLSPYIRSGRQWVTPLDEKGNTDLVRSLYKNAEQVLAFGPNPLYGATDALLMGKLEHPAKERLAQAIQNKEAIESLKNNQDKSTIDLPGRTITKDGGVSFGQTEEEAEAAERSVFDEGLQLAKDLIDADEYGLIGVGAGLLAAPFTGGLSLYNAIGYAGIKIIGNALGNYQSIVLDVASIKYEHEFAKKEREKESKQIAQAATKTALGKRKNDLSMRRAYPTFKIFFIEDDSGDSELINDGIVRAFDDFYSYSAVQEIKVTRSRHIASDLAVIRMTNVGGVLLRKRFGDSDKDNPKAGIGAEKQGIFAETEFEHPFEKMVLQNGVKCQIRLGYAANADNLETVFLGQIVEVSLAENGKIVEIMCQGYGAELESVELGPLENGPYFLSSQAALSGTIIQDSIANFGRQDRFQKDNPAALRHRWTGGSGKGLLAGLSPSNILQEWSERGLDATFNRYTFKNFQQDDNIYAPPPEVYTTSWERFWENACVYRPLKQTPWEIFKEHELRHPGYISLAVPYGHSPRMTMFFGNKTQHYWSKPPSALEIELSRGAKNEIVKLRKQGLGLLQKGLIKQLVKLVEKSPELGTALFNDIMTTGTRYDTGFALGELFGRYVPFRNYHYFDSAHHILKNEIRTSVDGTFNEVEIYYTAGEDNIIDANAKDLRDQTVAEDLLAVKLDENIPEASIRSYKGEFPSCVTVDMARRYAQGIFGQTLRDAYKGELIVIGDEKVKPYDVCYLNDVSINMTGPIEVESVTHIFNRDLGFVSIITPDLCVEVNDYYTASVFDVTASAMSISYADALIGSPAWLALKGIGFLGLAAGVKFMMWSQEGAPVMATPLTLGGKPFLSNSLGPNRVSLFTSVNGKWNQYWDDFDDAWRKFDLSESLFQARVDFTQGIFEFFGESAAGSLEEA